MTDSLENTIIKYGQAQNVKDLQNYLVNFSISDVTKVVVGKLSQPNFISFFNYVLQALDSSDNYIENLHSIIISILKNLNYTSTSTTQCNLIITRLCLEIPKLYTKDLLELCDFCIECIQNGNVSLMSWKEVFPELTNVILDKDVIHHDENELTGSEYKTELITSLCSIQWSANIIIPLTIMFIDMPLTKEEHLRVVNKLVCNMEKVTAQEMPTFVYHLLKLCKSQNGRIIFIKLQNYFQIRIYGRPNFGKTFDSDSMNLIGKWFTVVDLAKYLPA